MGARVGQHGQPTRVELQVPPSMASLVIAQAGPGGDGVGGFGGSGYSGGGGGDSDYGGDGGTNGRNGYGGFGSDSAGGGGSGVDVDQAPIVGLSIGYRGESTWGAWRWWRRSLDKWGGPR